MMITKTFHSKIVALLLCLSMALGVGAVALLGGAFNFDADVHAEEEGETTTYKFDLTDSVASTIDGENTGNKFSGGAGIQAVTDTFFTDRIRSPYTIEGDDYFVFALTGTNAGKERIDNSTKSFDEKPATTVATSVKSRYNTGGSGLELSDSKYYRGVFFRPSAGTQSITVTAWGSQGVGRAVGLFNYNLTPTALSIDNALASYTTVNTDRAYKMFSTVVVNESETDLSSNLYGITANNGLYIQYIEVTESGDAPSHTYKSETVLNPTCASAGVSVKYCKSHYTNVDDAIAGAGLVKADIASWTAGEYADDEEGEDGAFGKVTVTIIPQLSHNYANGVWKFEGDAKKPTTSATGEQYRMCGICNGGEKQTRVIPMLEDGCVTTYDMRYLDNGENYGEERTEIALKFATGNSPFTWVGRDGASLEDTTVGASATSKWEDFIDTNGVLTDKDFVPGDSMVRFKASNSRYYNRDAEGNIVGSGQTLYSQFGLEGGNTNCTEIMPDVGYFKFSATAGQIISLWAVAAGSSPHRAALLYEADASGKPIKFLEYIMTKEGTTTITPTIFNIEKTGNYAIAYGTSGINLYAIRVQNHNWGTVGTNGWVIETPADCVTEGAKHRECTVCDFEQELVIPETSDDGHHIELHYDPEATCTTAGSVYGVCEICGYQSASESYNKPAHKHKVTFYNGTTKLGEAEFNCGAVIGSIEEFDVSGFTFSGWYTDSALTKAYDATTKYTGDVTLYAKFTADNVGGCGSIGVPSDMGGIFILLGSMMLVLMASTAIKRRKAVNQ